MTRILAFLRDRSTKMVTNREYMLIYDTVQHQCDTEDNNEHLYAFFENAVKSYIKNELHTKMRDKSGEALIRAYVECWTDYTLYAKLMDKMFDYLNRYYLKNNNMPLLGDRCLRMFHEEFFIKHKGTIIEAVLQQISRDRDNDEINLENLKITLQSYVDMGLDLPKPMKMNNDGGFVWQGEKNLSVYDTEFETFYLARTKQEYERKATNWNSQKNCPEYLQAVDRALDHEESRADYWLQSETKVKMLKIVETELITKKAEAVVGKDTGCDYMFKNKRLDELSLLYKIFRRDDSTFLLIINKMQPYIESRGQKVTQDENLQKDPIEFTAKLLDLKKEMDEMIETSFHSHLQFQKGRDTSFSNFINACEFSAMYLA